MTAAVVCSYHRYGYCKYKETCNNLHMKEVCSIKDCSSESCLLRHPRLCRFFSLTGTCKFGSDCAYRHTNLIQEEIAAIKLKIDELSKKIAVVLTAIENVNDSAPRVSCRGSVDLSTLPIAQSSSLIACDHGDAIPQLDGNVMLENSTSSEVQPKSYQKKTLNDSLKDVSYDHAVDIGTFNEDFTAGKLCKFCETEFKTLSDFLSHMRRFGFVCNNCLDYYSDSPWYPEAEAQISFVLTGAILPNSSQLQTTDDPGTGCR